MIEIHAQAVLDRLNAEVTAPRLVFLGRVDPPVSDLAATPYVLARFSEAPPTRNYVAVTHEYAARITCHCVGANERAAMQIADLVAAALLDYAPPVPGRSCWPISWDDSSEQRPDEAAGTGVHNQVRVYLLRSIPA